MEQSQDEGSRHVRTEDLLEAPPVGRAMALAGLAAVVGAAIWGLLRIYGEMEHGAVAWGIGGLIGFAIIKAGGHGQMLSIAGGVLAVLSIAAGKQISYQSEVSEAIEMNLKEAAPHYETMKVDAEAWAALGDSPSDDAVTEFALDHDFDVQNADELRSEFVPGLERFFKEKPTRDEWLEWNRTDIETYVATNYTFMDYMKEDFSIIDLVFIALGIATAFGMVHKHTIALQVEARRKLRDDREDEPEDEADE